MIQREKPAKQTKEMKNRRKPYRFSLIPQEYGDVISFLEATPKPLRGHLIAESLRQAKRNLSVGGGNREGKGLPEFKGSFSIA